MTTITDPETIECRHCEGTGEVKKDGYLDLSSIEAVRAELVDVVTRGAHGIYSGNRIDRMQTLGRIGFLSSRLVWLESIDFLQQPNSVIPV